MVHSIRKRLASKASTRCSFLVVGIHVAIYLFLHMQMISQQQIGSISQFAGISEHTGDTYTLVVVRCAGNMTWLDDVPKDWRIYVYEKCLSKTKPISTNYSIPTTNKGSEECNGYLDYLYDHYDNLTSVTIFVHDDAFYPWSKWKGASAHTPFASFYELVNATKTYLLKDQGFLHFGVSKISQPWGTDVNHGAAEKILWPYIRTDEMPNPPEKVVFKPSAHMAVRREAIQRRKRETYYAMLQQVRHTSHVPDHLEARQFCCALERSWHMLFGEQPALSQRANVAQQLRDDGILLDIFGHDT